MPDPDRPDVFDFLDSYSRDRKFFLSLPTLWKVGFIYDDTGRLEAGESGSPGSESDGKVGLPSAIERALKQAGE